MNYAFLYHMKSALVTLKMITRGVHITVSVTSMALIQMKHERMENGQNYGIFGHEVKTTERSAAHNVTR